MANGNGLTMENGKNFKENNNKAELILSIIVLLVFIAILAYAASHISFI